jgi:gamma-glutamylcyclotransferase (GGCT)/AIG2-like uncharacterized protein YtfP
MQSPPVPTSIFVYGTLKQGGARCGLWPHPAQRIAPSRTRGQLYDLGPYPALLPGDDWVLGERWQIAPEHVARTLQVLDDVEGHADQPDDLYVRGVVTCVDLDGTEVKAHTYLLAQTRLLDTARRILPDSRGECRWPSPAS